MLLLPFEGDRFLFGSVARLCALYKVVSIVETGTAFGATTKALALLAESVVTIESEPYTLSGLPYNVVAMHMKSDAALPMILPNLKHPILFFLDAHNNHGTALLDELRILSESKCFDCPIVIHDFKVPEKEFGFDRYGETELNQDFVREAIKPFIEKGYTLTFNSEVEGCCRGTCFLNPHV